MGQEQSSGTIGRACAYSAMHCRNDELWSNVLDLVASGGHKFCAVTFRAGSCEHSMHIERNAHALSTAARALRTAAERLEQISEDAAGQERMDLATVQAALTFTPAAQEVGGSE